MFGEKTKVQIHGETIPSKLRSLKNRKGEGKEKRMTTQMTT